MAKRRPPAPASSPRPLTLPQSLEIERAVLGAILLIAAVHYGIRSLMAKWVARSITKEAEKEGLRGDLAKAFDTFVITDEVYEHIVYAPHRHHYMAALPDMFERTISCSSL